NTLGNRHAELEGLIQEIERVDAPAHLDTYIQQSSQYILLGIIFASACTSFQRSEYKTPLSISLVCSKWHVELADWIEPFRALSELTSSCDSLQTFTVIMRGRYVDDIQDAGDWLARNLIAALHRMQGLRALRIIEAESGPPLSSKQLFQEMAEGKLLPALMSLELVWAEDRRPADALIPMLTSRCGQGGTGMKTISSVVLGMRNGRDLRGDVLDCMANLREQGTRATLW
ncbi:hypothetical protein CPB85DRAFT_1332178, partial [Mucidula mucida]